MQLNVKVNEALLANSLQRGLRLFRAAGFPVAAGNELFVRSDAVFEGYAQLVGPVLPRTMGAFSYARSPILPYVSVGRYCSIGKSLDFLSDRHPSDWGSTSPFSYEAGFSAVSDYARDRDLPVLRFGPMRHTACRRSSATTS